MAWYYVDQRRQCGPVSRSELDQRMQDGRLGRNTLVWTSGMDDWLPYADTVGAAKAAVGPAVPSAQVNTQPHCGICGEQHPLEQMVAFKNYCVCENCKPIHDQRLREGIIEDGVMIGTTQGGLMIAGFWIRFAAFLIDMVILTAVNWAIGLLAGAIQFAARDVSEVFILVQVFVAIISWSFMFGYEIFFLGKFGATPGKMLLKLKVVTDKGENLTWGRATGRVFAKWLSYCTMYIGFIIAAFDEHRRTLHDHICNTRVIKVSNV